MLPGWWCRTPPRPPPRGRGGRRPPREGPPASRLPGRAGPVSASSAPTSRVIGIGHKRAVTEPHAGADGGVGARGHEPRQRREPPVQQQLEVAEPGGARGRETAQSRDAAVISAAGRVSPQDDEALRTRTAATVTGRRDRDRWTMTPGPGSRGGGADGAAAPGRYRRPRRSKSNGGHGLQPLTDGSRGRCRPNPATAAGAWSTPLSVWITPDRQLAPSPEHPPGVLRGARPAGRLARRAAAGGCRPSPPTSLSSTTRAERRRAPRRRWPRRASGPAAPASRVRPGERTARSPRRLPADRRRPRPRAGAGVRDGGPRRRPRHLPPALAGAARASSPTSRSRARPCLRRSRTLGLSPGGTTWDNPPARA